ncbi:MAG: nucleotide sugar dehydrogenase [Candidatus Brocadiae bacterium]|nr:nucleotide sugar dehydrogenase [Candidatus Brocadiia bacterium]
MTDPARTLLPLIASKKILVGIIGLGYVGLPLARVFSQAGIRVLGFDIDPAKVRSLGRGRSYIKSVSATTVKEMTKRGFEATADFARLSEPDAILICVPTPLTETRDPDMSYIEKTCEAISKRLRRGQIVVLESTTYPGTTEEVCRPILERSGLAFGKDFLLAFSPEREDPGNPNWSTERIPKVVGGLDAASGSVAAALYGAAVVRVVPVSSAAAAEATKLLENIYRCVNIALVNELKVVFERMGIDVWEVIDAASTKPFGFQPFTPGPGLGGHCIPIDPFYLSWKARQYDVTTRFIELAGEINASMPYYVVSRVAEALDRRGKTLHGARILLLGIAYKKNSDDVRESPALKLIDLLQERGAKLEYHDPHVPKIPPTRKHAIRMSSRPLTPALLRKQDAVLVVTDHADVDYAFVAKHAALVVDTRNAMKGSARRGRVVKA